MMVGSEIDISKENVPTVIAVTPVFVISTSKKSPELFCEASTGEGEMWKSAFARANRSMENIPSRNDRIGDPGN